MKRHAAEARALTEVRTGNACLHPYFGFVCPPGTTIDFSDRVRPHFGHGAIARIGASGFRNWDQPAHKPDGEIWIGLFGGSVAFSVLSTDENATLSAHLTRSLQRLLIERGDHRVVRVINFAIPGGQQPQQLLVFLLNRNLLDGAVTFDGVNEVIVPTVYNGSAVPASFPYLPYYQALYGRDVSDEQIAVSWMLDQMDARYDRLPSLPRMVLKRAWESIRARVVRRLNRPSGAHFASSFPQGSDEAPTLDEQIKDGARNWYESVLAMHDIATIAGVQTMFALQPVPERGKRLTPLEESFLASHPEMVNIRQAGFDLLRGHVADLRTRSVLCHDFATVFSEERRTVYADVVHFEDIGCEIVGQRMAEALVEAWPLLRSSRARGDDVPVQVKDAHA